MVFLIGFESNKVTSCIWKTCCSYMWKYSWYFKEPLPQNCCFRAPYSCDYNIVTKTVYYLNWNIFNGTNIAIIAHYGIIPNELKNQKHNTILLLSKFLDSNEDVCYQHYGIIYYSNGNSKTMKYAIKIRSTKCLQHK